MTMTPTGLSPARALRTVTAQPAAVRRLVCFPHSGGGPAMFHRWVAGLAPDIEVWPVALPGRAGRISEPFARRWTPLVGALAEEILATVQPPIALFGHSLGALLAFEVARAMTRAGDPPAHLIVSARSAPHVARHLTLPEDDDELLDLVGRVYGGVPDVLHKHREMREHFVPILRADLELVGSYVSRAARPLPCPITALGGDADPTVPASELDEWSRYTSATFERRLFPGGHFYLTESERPLLDTLWRRVVRHRKGA